ncbi:MAG: ABC transporter substrate-binding protein [Chloroflexi bacterium]|nr:ABC transporter substrate-binding protein [Chloroflexota bacterium]
MFAVTVAAACGTDTPRDIKQVTFMAGFKPQANLPFVAAYVAQDKGYFAEQGLEVDIRHSASGEHLQLLMSGDVDFTTADATSVLKRRSEPDLPIVAFALFGQKGQQGFVSLADSGIAGPKDWEGKTFGYKFSQPPDYLAILEAESVDRSKINEVRVGFDPRVLTEGQVDVLAVFKSNEPDTIRGLGFDVNLWDPADFGVPTLGLTYITRSALADEDPEVVKRFLKATLKGLEFAMANREETLDIVLKFAPDEKREHQRFMLDAEIADAVGPVTDSNGAGWMTDQQWQALYNQLIQYDALPRPFDYTTAYTYQFLDAAYDDGELIWP